MMATVKSKVVSVLRQLSAENNRVNSGNNPGLCYYAAGKILFNEEAAEELLHLGDKKRKLPSETQLHNINIILASDDVGQPRLRAYTGFTRDPSRAVVILGIT
jgi:hypothetical protein